MPMKIEMKRLLGRLHLDSAAKELIKLARQARRKAGGADANIIRAYFSQNNVRKLHIGCGSHPLPGWLNSDYYPPSSEILHLDATQPFPFGEEEFDFVFSEHMIEHVPYGQGLAMLAECLRVLRRNGVIRISTPNLPFLIKLYDGQNSELEKRYIEWATKAIVKDAPYSDPIFVINNFFRDWGHQFIYDEKTLAAALRRSGFADIEKCELNESTHEELRQLENEKRLPSGFLRLETLTLEAAKLV